MSRLVPLWVAVLQTLGVFGLCAVLLQLVRRGRWVKWNHPVCATCGFNLYGLPQTSSRCPECGEELEKVRKMGVWRRRWASLALALLLLVAGLWVTWTQIWVRRVNDLDPYMPTFALLLEASSPRYAQRALWELQRRAEHGELSDRQWAIAARRVISSGSVWGPLPGTSELMWRGRAAGKVPDAVWSRFVRQLVRIWPTRARSVAARGKPLTVIYVASLTARSQNLGHDFTLRLRPLISIGAVTLLDRTNDPVELPLPSDAPAVVTLTPVLPSDPRLTDGPQTVSIATDIDVMDAHHPGTVVSHEHRVESVYTTIAPRGQPSVTVVDPATLAPADVARVRKQFTVLSVPLDGRPPTFDGLDLANHAFYTLPPLPNIDHAYRVYLRESPAGPEQLLGTLILARTDQQWTAATTRPSVRSQKVDVLLKPAPDAAESTLQVNRILGGELLTPDVPVRQTR